MRRKLYCKLLTAFILIAPVWLNHGCGYVDRHPTLVAIKGRANTFRLAPLPPFPDPIDGVRAIRVYEHDTLWSINSKILWEIRAKEYAKLEGFEVVVGEVPKGFEQIIPDPREKFTPIPGESYVIAVSLMHPSAMPWAARPWVAE